MITENQKKDSGVIIVIVIIIIFYYMMRITTLVSSNGGNWNLEYFSKALNEIYILNTPLDIQSKNIAISFGVSFFALLVYETYKLQNKRNIQEKTYGSAEWMNPKDISNKKDKNFENNMILTQTEMISKNMQISQMNRHVIRHYDKRHQNFTEILKLIRLSNPDNNGVSELDRLFKKWEIEEPDAIGVKQYKHFKVAASAPKMMSTIIMTATARLAVFNIKEVANLTDYDDMELERIGMPTDDNSPLLKQINETTGKNIKNGKIAYFIVTKPSDSTFNFLASIFYTQVFAMIDENAKRCGGSLATSLEIYMDEWAQLRRNT